MNLAVINAEGYCPELPGRYELKLGEETLLEISIKTVKASGLFEQVVVSTEDPNLKILAEKHGIKVFDRPRSLRGAFATREAVLGSVSGVPTEEEALICVLSPSVPFLRPTDLTKASVAVLSEAKAQAVVSCNLVENQPVTRLRHGKSMYYHVAKRFRGAPTPARTLNPAFAMTKAWYWKEMGQLVGDRSLVLDLPVERNLTVSTYFDFLAAEAVFRELQKVGM